MKQSLNNEKKIKVKVNLIATVDIIICDPNDLDSELEKVKKEYQDKIGEKCIINLNYTEIIDKPPEIIKNEPEIIIPQYIDVEPVKFNPDNLKRIVDFNNSFKNKK